MEGSPCLALLRHPTPDQTCAYRHQHFKCYKGWHLGGQGVNIRAFQKCQQVWKNSLVRSQVNQQIDDYAKYGRLGEV